ncbi:MAG: MYXO-CTERM sorting domain-containing protein [Myxococcaceae bacterium]
MDAGTIDDAGTSEQPGVDAGSDDGSVQGRGCGCGSTGGGAFAFLLLVPFMRRRRAA